jgi:hypothetical protein
VIWFMIGCLVVFTMWPLLLKLTAKKPTQWDDDDDLPPGAGSPPAGPPPGPPA